MEYKKNPTGARISERRVLGPLIYVGRIVGLLFIALAILSLPQMQSLTGYLAGTLRFISSLTLGLVGIALLVGVNIFVNFFDQFLSRN